MYCPVTVYEVIARLPAPEIVRARSKAMAMLDAVLSPEWKFRYYSYDRLWAPSEELASMKDGSGNDYVIVFAEPGVYAQATCHESPISAYRVSPCGAVAWSVRLAAAGLAVLRPGGCLPRSQRCSASHRVLVAGGHGLRVEVR